MKREKALEILREAGIKAEEGSVLKNGRRIPSIIVGEGSIRPTLYQHHIENIEDADELIEFVEIILNERPEVNPSDFYSKEYVLEHAISCVRHETEDEEIVKYSVYGDLEEYFRVIIGHQDEGTMSVVITKAIAKNLNIDSAELRKAARENTAKTVSIRGMSEVISGMIGTDIDLPLPEEEMMYVATAHGGMKGASVMLLESVLSEFCENHGVEKLIIIPSSTEEILLIPACTEDESSMNSMVQEVNETQIPDESERLSDHIYYYTGQ